MKKKLADDYLDSLLLPYQKEWVTTPKKRVIWEKSRRIGATYAWAFRAVVMISKSNGRHQKCISLRLESSKDILKDCEDWIHRFAEKYPQRFDINDYIINKLVITHKKTGLTIKALSSNINNLRGGQGDILLDECAFNPSLLSDLEAVVPATSGLGRLDLISTHNGHSSQFNQLVENSRAYKENLESLKILILDNSLDIKIKEYESRVDCDVTIGNIPDKLYTEELRYLLTEIEYAGSVWEVFRTPVDEALKQGVWGRKGMKLSSYEEGKREIESKRLTFRDGGAQEYDAVPVRGLSNLFPPLNTMNRVEPLIELTDSSSMYCDQKVKTEFEYLAYIGCDVAEGLITSDRTVIVGIGNKGSLMYFQDFQLGSLENTQNILIKLLTNNPKAKLGIDCIGVGAGISQVLTKKFNAKDKKRVIPIRTNQFNKSAMLHELADLYRRGIEVPRLKGFEIDLECFVVEENGKIVTERRSGRHGDSIMASAFAVAVSESELSKSKELRLKEADKVIRPLRTSRHWSVK